MIKLDDLILPDELVWVDETDWTPVAQNEEYFVAGSLHVQNSVKLAGRPITLSREDGEVWTSRETVLALMEMAAQPGKKMTLTLHDNRKFTVIFRHKDKGIEARQVKEFNHPQADTYYTLTLRFIEVVEEE
ncbi:MAG: hypothetical protein CSB24_00795 [Deltaproteobacteria bacterium]|nr:MAG: hypothetical protein CSB24_00795 [Deltaproteobacteria bacterium]